MLLLCEIGRNRASTEDPQAAAIGEIDNRQRRQHSNEEAAEQNRLTQS
jgi:hypothetical protein